MHSSEKTLCKQKPRIANKKDFNKWALINHPDKFPNASEGENETITQLFQDVSRMSDDVFSNVDEINCENTNMDRYYTPDSSKERLLIGNNSPTINTPSPTQLNGLVRNTKSAEIYGNTGSLPDRKTKSSQDMQYKPTTYKYGALEQTDGVKSAPTAQKKNETLQTPRSNSAQGLFSNIFRPVKKSSSSLEKETPQGLFSNIFKPSKPSASKPPASKPPASKQPDSKPPASKPSASKTPPPVVKKTKKTCSTNKNTGPPCDTGYLQKINKKGEECCYKIKKESNVKKEKKEKEKKNQKVITPKGNFPGLLFGMFDTDTKVKSAPVVVGKTATTPVVTKARSAVLGKASSPEFWPFRANLEKASSPQFVKSPVNVKKMKRECSTNRNPGPPCGTGFSLKKNKKSEDCCYKTKTNDVKKKSPVVVGDKYPPGFVPFRPNFEKAPSPQKSSTSPVNVKKMKRECSTNRNPGPPCGTGFSLKKNKKSEDCCYKTKTNDVKKKSPVVVGDKYPPGFVPFRPNFEKAPSSQKSATSSPVNVKKMKRECSTNRNPGPPCGTGFSLKKNKKSEDCCYKETKPVLKKEKMKKVKKDKDMPPKKKQKTDQENTKVVRPANFIKPAPNLVNGFFTKNLDSHRTTSAAVKERIVQFDNTRLNKSV
jgi:hypothetical protein